MMDSILPLKFTAKLVCIQTLFKHLDEPDSDILSEYTTSLLETDCFTAVSEDILHRITKYFPENLNNRLLKALLPSHVKELNITSCHNVTLMGLVDVLKKCSHLQKLNLCGCTQLMVTDIFTCMGLLGLQITTISVEGNQNVTDDIVQTMIKFLPTLRNLDISCCSKVTDDVFLVEKEIQLRRETSKQPLTGTLSRYRHKLHSVDISGCGGLTSVAVRHLTSLSGPYLQHVSIAYTRIDCTALFSLTGYSFPSIIDFVMNGDEKLKKDADLKEYLEDLKEIAAVYGISISNQGDEEIAEDKDKNTDARKHSNNVSHPAAQGENDDSNGKRYLQALSVKEYANSVNNLTATGQEDIQHDKILGVEETENMECFLGLSEKNAKLSEEFALSENAVEIDTQIVHKMEGLCIAESGLHSENYKECDASREKGLLTGLMQNELNEIQDSRDAENNKNSNGHECKDYRNSPFDKSNQIHTDAASGTMKLVNNFVTNETECVVDDSPHIHVDINQADMTDIKQADTTFYSSLDCKDICAECVNDSKYAISSKTKNIQRDLNKNVCDIHDCDVNAISNICSVSNEMLPQNSVKSSLSCDNNLSLNVLKESEFDVRTNTDTADNTVLEGETQCLLSHTESFDYEFAINEVEQCNQCNFDSGPSTGLTDENIPPIDNKVPIADYINADEDTSEKYYDTVENVDDLESLECNKTDDAKLQGEGKCFETDEDDGSCEECESIRDKIKASRSRESDWFEANVFMSERNVAETHKSSDRTGSDTGDNLQRVEGYISRSVVKQDGNTLDNEISSHKNDLERSESELISIVNNEIIEIERNLDSIDEKLSVGMEKCHQAVQLYEPNLISLNIESMKFPSKQLGQLCLEKFFQMNKQLKSFKTNWKGLSETLTKTILPSMAKIQELSLEECSWLQNGGIGAVAKSCPNLRKVNFRGVVFIKDMAMVPYLFLSDLSSLDLAESEITDSTLVRLANRCSDRLTDLDLSWCEEITEKGVNEICCKCSKLEDLTLKKCPVSDITLSLMAENCHLLRELTIESVEDVTENIFSDAGISEIGQNLRYLQKLDISWNLSITNISISVIMSQCRLLEEAYMKGLKQITGVAFHPIIADYEKWQRCQALLKLKKRERQNLQEIEEDTYSSDEEYEALMIPHRSTSYAPNLRVLDLEYSDLVEDEKMMEIVSVCRGSLRVIDYYGQELKPKLFIRK